tara:strand:- start:386 stop:589 length:204 start_codon:yes stop_codon:yes gene_type:complete
MADFVFDKDIVQEIKRVIFLSGKTDLLEYFEYLCETIATIEVSDSDDEADGEELDVGETEDGFFYLK